MNGRARWMAAAALALAGCATDPSPRGGGSLVEIIYLDEDLPEASGAGREAGEAGDAPDVHEAAERASQTGETGAGQTAGETGAGETGAGETGAGGTGADGTSDGTGVGEAAPRPERAGALLPGVHPTVRAGARQLVDRLAAEGIHIKIIFGYTPYSKRKRTGPGGWASWHEFGLAFDLNLASRKSLSDAKKHFAEDAAAWKRIGEIATELGLVWGGSWRSTYDPFHCEWHPGHDAVINKEDLRQLMRLAGPGAKRYQATWSLYPAPAADER